MVMLCTVAEARMQIMVDTNAHDPWFEMMIPAISQAVLSWLKQDWRAYELLLDSNGDVVEDSGGPVPQEDSNGPIVKPMVKAATLIELAVQFRFRDGDGAPIVPATSGHGYILSVGATALLNGVRKTTIA